MMMLARCAQTTQRRSLSDNAIRLSNRLELGERRRFCNNYLRERSSGSSRTSITRRTATISRCRYLGRYRQLSTSIVRSRRKGCSKTRSLLYMKPSLIVGSLLMVLMLPASSNSEILLIGNHQQETEENDDTETPIMMACSSVTLRDSDESSLLGRIICWFRRWWKHGWNFMLVTTRITEVALRLSPLLILTPSAVVSGSPLLSDIAWRYTISALQGIGPIAVKFCQWVATRRDIFPPFFCDRLAVLHNNVSPHSWSYTHKVLTEAFGDYRSKGLEVHEVIGCGSAAQVYKGTIVLSTKGEKINDKSKDEVNETDSKKSSSRNNQRTVAVKVLHPNFENQIDRDLEVMRIIANFLHSLPSMTTVTESIRMLNLPRATENFGALLRIQVDLTIEAKNLQRFRSNFYHDSEEEEHQSSITFPQPLEEWCSSPKVIIEDFVHDAEPIANFLKDSSPAGITIRRELAGPLLRAFLKMIFLDNFIHGDLHPGNVLVRTTTVDNPPNQDSIKSWWDQMIQPPKNSSETGKVNRKHSIVFLDAGIANSLGPEDQRNLADLFRAVILNEGDRAGRLMVERAKFERCSQVPGGVDAFAKGVGEIVSEFHDRRKEGLTLGTVRIGSLLARVLELCRIHGVEIDPNFTSVVISTLVLEGLGRSLSPELNMMDFAKPFILGRGRV